MLLTSCLAVNASTVAAQDVADIDAAPIATVEVNGLFSTTLASYKTLVAGMDAYARERAMAPASTLYFRIVKTRPTVSFVGLQAELVGPTLRLPLQVDGVGKLTVERNEAALADRASLIVNRRKDAVTLQPAVISAGLAPGVRRLGDLRLQCQVAGAMKRDAMSLFERRFLSIAALCKSMDVVLPAGVARRYLGFVMRDGARSERNDTRAVSADGNVATIALDDPSWSDESVIEYLTTR
ncbi:MAG: hypothetical protein ABIT83_26225 [Massilia sp.]